MNEGRADHSRAAARGRKNEGEPPAEAGKGPFHIIHGAASVSRSLPAAVSHGERDLGKLRRHAQKPRSPHPEHRAGAAYRKRPRDPRYVRRANRASERRSQSPEG